MTRAGLTTAAVIVVAGLAGVAGAQPDTIGEPPPGPGSATGVINTEVDTAPITPAAGKQVKWEVTVGSPANDEGKKLRLTWKRDSMLQGSKLVILRHETGPKYVSTGDHRYVGMHETPVLAADFLFPEGTDDGCEAKPLDASILTAEVGKTWGEWTVVGIKDEEDGELTDEVVPGKSYVYTLAPALLYEDRAAIKAFLGEAVMTRPRAAMPAWFDRSKTFFLVFILLTGAAFLIYIEIAKRKGKDMFIRRIPGIDAIEDAVGRSTEMGRPVLYVTGIEEITSIQTIASLLILGHVAEMTAEYDTELKVANTYPMTMIVAEEIVRNSYTNVGRADAHRPENIMFITSEQFAFAAAVNGMILRDRVATNIFLGKFFAESLILAETGFMAGAVQIAGTAEFTQLPFFVAACDYTLIGEELYACGAYLSREPNQIAQIKAGDVMKVLVVSLIVIGVIAATAQGVDVIGKLIP